jgi:NOL1/NOP2/fmu family ribosome biogenesis protein
MDAETALNYLHKDTMEGGATADGGFLATYAGLGLGWGKMIAGRRVNNHYPAPRRILMDVPKADCWSLLDSSTIV